MIEPVVIPTASGVSLYWPSPWDLTIAASRIVEHKDKRVTAELRLSTGDGESRSLLHQSQLNLLAPRSRKDIIDTVKARHASMDDSDWASVMEQACFLILEHTRQGEPAVDIGIDEDYPQPTFLLWPFLFEKMPTVLYGPGGSGKSFLGLLMAMAVSLPWKYNPLGFVAPDEPVKSLYLDYETERNEIGYRLKSIAKGMGMNAGRIKYRRCSSRLADDIESIKQLIESNNIGFIVVDSLGKACGGDLKESEPAIAMFSALRQLEVTSLLITHMAKGNSEKGRESSPYGTTYFKDYGRSVWEIQTVQEVNEDTIDVGLFHKKVNSSKKLGPFGYRIAFNDDKVTFKSRDVSDMNSLADRVPLPARIMGLFRRKNCKMLTGEIATELEAKEETVRRTLNRMKEKGQVDKWGELWGELSKIEEPF